MRVLLHGRVARVCHEWTANADLFDDLIRPQQQRLWNRQPKSLRGLEVDDEFELGWLLDGKVGGLRALEDLVHIDRRTSIEVTILRPIRHEITSLGVTLDPVHGWQATVHRELRDAAPLVIEHWLGEYHQAVDSRLADGDEGAVDFIRGSCLETLQPHPQRLRCRLCLRPIERVARVRRVSQHRYARGVRDGFREQLQPLAGQFTSSDHVPRYIS